MAIRSLRRDGGVPRSVRSGVPQIHQPEKPTRYLQEKRQGGLEICLCEDCHFGPIEVQPIMAVLRFTTGYLRYRKFGPWFEESLRFFDGRKHKFTHSICAYDQGIVIDRLRRDLCVLCPSTEEGIQFYCEREPKECCLLVEQGYFHPVKGGRFSRFIPEKTGAVHWACARVVWNQRLLTEEFDGNLHDVGTP